ncbi:MAG: outer membrane protein transport protein [Pseudomonadota bacterium]|nr:outer membrane protein transport protein [Pseudomonadota bacterium]
MSFNKLTGAILFALASQTVSASGFGLIEHSASGQGLSYAGAAANAEDASVMWFNPAGLTEIEGSQAIIGGHIISPSAKFTNDDSYTAVPANLISGNGDDGATVGFVPSIYWKGNMAGYDVGLGINVPFGQHISYDDDWAGRYHATETNLKTLNINPAIARKINDKLSFGFGLNAQYVDVILEQKINQSALGDTDANAKVTGDSWAYGYNLGLMYKPTDKLNVGLAYRSAMTHDVEGKVDYSGVNSTINLGGYTLNQVMFDADATASVSLPASATLAFDYQLNDKTQLLAGTTWTGWKAYDELVVDFDNGAPDSESNQNFKDSMRYAVGVIYKLDDSWKLRSGLAFDESPVPDETSRSPRTPDSDRTWVSFGVGYKFNSTINLDFGYTHIFADKADVEYTAESSLGDNVLVGSYDASVNILSAQLVWKY